MTPSPTTLPLSLSEEERADVQSMVHSLAVDWRSDATLRTRAAEGREILSERGYDVSNVDEVRIVENTDEVFHLVMPLDPNSSLMDEELDGVSGGAQTVGTASRLGTIPSCISTASSTQTHTNP